MAIAKELVKPSDVKSREHDCYLQVGVRDCKPRRAMTWSIIRSSWEAELDREAFKHTLV